MNTANFSWHCARLAAIAAKAAADSLELPPTAADAESVARFLADMRARLDRLEQAARGESE